MKKIFLILAMCSSSFAMSFKDHNGSVTAIAFDKTGKSVITGSSDGVVCKRGIESGKIQTIGGLGQVTQLKRIDEFLAIVQTQPKDEDAAIHPRPDFYNIGDLTYKSSGAVKDGKGHANSITDMQIINSKSMVSADQQGRVVFLYNCMRSVVMDAGSSIDRLSVASPSRIFGINRTQDRLYKFDPELNKVWSRPLFNASAQMTAIAALKEYLLAVSFQDGRVALLNDKTGKTEMKLFQACQGEIADLQKINKRFFATIRKDGQINIWDAKTQECKRMFANAGGFAVTAAGIHWNKKTKKALIATGFADGSTSINCAQL